MTKAEALKNASERAVSRGFVGRRGFALVQFMSAEERCAYYREQTRNAHLAPKMTKTGQYSAR